MIWRRTLLASLTTLSLGIGAAEAEASLEGRTLRWENDGKTVWQYTFPKTFGDLSTPVTYQGDIYLGVGPAVYAYSTSGELLGRADLPAQVSALDTDSKAVSATTVGEYEGQQYTERFTLGDPGTNFNLPVLERVVVPPDPQVSLWLSRTADQVPLADLAQARQRDPSNPFLALKSVRAAQQDGDDYTALSIVRQSLSRSLTFAQWTELATRLDGAGFPAAADLALERAKRDAAARGLDPQVPVSRAALFAYGNPSGYVGTLLEQNRLSRADVWMNFLRELYPRFEGSDSLYARYAELLDIQGREGEAEEWRQFARSLRTGSLYNLGAQDTRALRDAARFAALTLLLALMSAIITLSARAWKYQRRDTQGLGGRWGSLVRTPLARLRLNLINYASFTERLSLVILATGLFTVLAGWQWSNQTGQGLRAPALNMGTYGGSWYATHLDTLDLRPSGETALLSGIAAQLDGDDALARESYLRSGQNACALNNLGVIAAGRDDPIGARDLYRSALSMRPDLTAAAYNLGLNPNDPGSQFQRQYRRGEARLCYPDRRDLARMLSGDMSRTLRQHVLNPFGFLFGQAPAGRLSWALLVGLALLALLAFSLLIPRAATDKRLGRPNLFRLLSVLLPGSGLLNNAWGGVLLVTWAAVVTALIPLISPVRFPFLPSPDSSNVRNILLATLLLCSVLNLLGVALLESRHLRRKRAAALEADVR